MFGGIKPPIWYLYITTGKKVYLFTINKFSSK